jgi:hypothetical protein
MADQPKIDPEKLDKYDSFLKGLWRITSELVDIFKSMSEQEKVLAGGLIFQAKSPWLENHMSVLLGGEEVLASLITRTILESKRKSSPEPPPVPPIFGQGKEEEFTN